MLSFVKNMFKMEATDHDQEPSTPAPVKKPVDISQLRPGCTVRFGFMPVSDLSRKQLTVADFNTYVFDKIQFTSFVLEDAEAHQTFLIIGEDEGVRYLVLSRRLEADYARELLNYKPLQKLSRSAKLGEMLELTPEQAAQGHGWMRGQYISQVLAMKGQFYQHGMGGQDAIEIDYSLFVSEDEECALEIERHGREDVHVFVTLYRPLSDILEIALPTEPPAAAIPEMPAPVPAIAEPELPFGGQLAEAALPMQDNAPAAEPEPVTEVYTATLPREDTGEMAALEFDIKVAAKLIDEAKKNKIPLADLVRKVIDLPKSVPEKIEIRFPLNTEDYHVLATRYHLHPSDREQIRQCVYRDLMHFTGES